jgi:hypothetical protein
MKDKIGRTCNMHVREEKLDTKFWLEKSEGNRLHGRPSYKAKDKFKMKFKGIRWENVAQNWDKWQVLVYGNELSGSIKSREFPG